MGEILEVVIHRIHGTSLRGLIITTDVLIFLEWAGELWLTQNITVGEKERNRKLSHMGLLSVLQYTGAEKRNTNTS